MSESLTPIESIMSAGNTHKNPTPILTSSEPQPIPGNNIEINIRPY